jgi:ABC-type transporter Mla subunit MlaD
MSDAHARIVYVPDHLGALGLSAAADALEDYADQLRAYSPMTAESLQQVADFLRATAVAVPEALRS